MMDPIETKVGNKILILSGQILTYAEEQIRLTVRSGDEDKPLFMLVNFTSVKKPSDSPVRLQVIDAETLSLNLEIVPEQTGTLAEPVLVAESIDSESIYLNFRAQVSHNGQIFFTYNFLVSNGSEPTSTKPSAKEKRRNGRKKK